MLERGSDLWQKEAPKCDLSLFSFNINTLWKLLWIFIYFSFLMTVWRQSNNICSNLKLDTNIWLMSKKNMIFRSSITSHGDKNVGSGWRAERDENQEKLAITGISQTLVNQYWTNLWKCICQNLQRTRFSTFHIIFICTQKNYVCVCMCAD